MPNRVIVWQDKENDRGTVVKVSHSRISTWQRCRREYKHKYINKVYPRKRPIYYVVGSAVHKFLEVYYSTRGRQADIALNAAKAEFEKIDRVSLSADEIHELECQMAMALGICKAYPRFYKTDFDQFSEFMSEQRHSFPLPGGHEYEAIIDLMARDQAGCWWIIETKTASQVTADYLRRIRIDWQVLGQITVAEKLLGIRPEGVIYNIIKKPGIRLKKGETKAQYQNRVFKEYAPAIAEAKSYFTREEIIVGDGTLSNFIKDLQIVVKEMAKNNSRYPMSTGACVNGFITCQYLNACIDRKYDTLQYERTS